MAVMAGLDPAIHVFSRENQRADAGTSPAMTTEGAQFVTLNPLDSIYPTG
jgi:hypothetical protein